MARHQLSRRNRLRVLNNVNDNYCVKCVTGLKDCACVSGKIKSLNPFFLSKAVRKANLSSVNFVTNIPSIASDLPVGARLHQFGENWEVLGASPKVVTVHR